MCFVHFERICVFDQLRWQLQDLLSVLPGNWTVFNYAFSLQLGTYENDYLLYALGFMKGEQILTYN